MIPEKKKNFQIKPWKPCVDSEAAYAEKTCKIVEDAIHEIFNHSASRTSSLEEVYRNVYNMVIHKHGEKLYSLVVNTMTQHIQEIAKRIESARGGFFLEDLNTKCLEYHKSVHIISNLLVYLDRSYVKTANRIPVHELGLNLWRYSIIRSTQMDRLLDTLLDRVHRERTGEVINRGLMRSITKMLSDLAPTFYEENFETPFLDSAAEFYKLESQQYIESSNCSDYLKKAERRLSEEIERVTHYLDPQTELKITAVVEREMIGNHMAVLVENENSGLVSMLIDDQYEDLARMYNLFRRVSGGVQLIRAVMINYLQETGRHLVMDPERLKDPVKVVQRLLFEKDKYDKFIHLSLGNDKLFRDALNLSFNYLISLNDHCPEFLSLFVDHKLREGFKSVSEVETVLDKVMVLFRYLKNKDVFEKYYKLHLARRLLCGRGASDDAAERSFIVKLKSECGYQFTIKLEGMFIDMKTSRDTLHGFSAMLSSSEAGKSPTLAVLVLTTGLWPLQSGCRCNLPTEILNMCDNFKGYYLSSHKGRRLTWHTKMGTADLEAIFGNGQTHELNVSTYQMCILLLFNTADKLSYHEIEQATDIPAQDLNRNLQSLACVSGKNVLRKEPMNNDIKEADVFYFNDDFVSKHKKVKLCTVVCEKDSEPGTQQTSQRVEENRKPQIEAAVVRVMKYRQVLDHSNLINEVTTQLQDRFLPNPSIIKQQIETLVEREFLERDPTDWKVYRYVA